MRRNIHTYANYRLFDFLLDADFKRWVIEPDALMDKHWQSVLRAHPEQNDRIQKAIHIIKHLPSHPLTASNDRKENLWKKIEKSIDESPVSSRSYHLSIFHYAAAILLFLSACVGIWMMETRHSLIHISTGSGEHKSILLTDGSKVLLAPNSSISYHRNLNHHGRREVWAKGDVKFDVVHINQDPQQVKKGETFVVYLDKKVQLEVLGTIFSIYNRRGFSHVKLLSGAVRVRQDEQKILMSPGEWVGTDNNSKLRIKKTNSYLSRDWENRKVILNRTRIEEIIELVKDTYGIVLKIENASLLEKEIDGILPLDHQERAFQIISSITGTSIEKKNNAYLLKEIK